MSTTGSGVYCPLCGAEMILSGNDQVDEEVYSDNYQCQTKECHSEFTHYWGEKVDGFM